MGRQPFQLQPVLIYRESLVEAREVELAAALKAQAQAEQALRELQEERTRCQAQVRAQRLLERLDPLELTVVEAYLVHLEERLAEQAALVQQLAAQTEQRRAALAEALKEQKKIQRLKERHELVAAQEEARIDQTRADDLNTARYARRKAVA